MAGLAAIGVGHIINLALHSHEKALADEAASVTALGMGYTHIPVEFGDPTQAEFDRFCSVMAAAGDAPVHVHCIANYRVSAFVYRYRRDVLGMDPALARADLDRIWQPDAVWTAFIGP